MMRFLVRPAPANESDQKRRSQNIAAISFYLIGLDLVLLGYAFFYEHILSNQLVLLGGLLGCLLINRLTNQRRVRLMGYLLVGLIFLVVLLGTLGRERFGLMPFYFTLGLMVAGAVLPPRDVLIAGAVTLLAIVGLWYCFGDLEGGSFPPGALLVGTLTVNATAAMIALSSALSVSMALESADREAEQASKTEQALRESERYYRLIADHSSDLIALIDMQGRFLYASPSYAHALGYAPVALIGTYCSTLLYPDDRTRADADADLARRTGAAQGYYRAITHNGEQRWFDMRMSVAYEEGEAYLITVIRDITERRDLESRLQEAQKMEALGRLAGGVAHDFNNLLYVISGGADLARAALPAEHPANLELNQVIDASQRAAGLTRQLLAFARRQPIEPRRIDLDTMLQEGRGLFERLAGPGVCLSIKIAPALWPVLADPSQLEQVLINMIVNARDAMPNGGDLRITLHNHLLDEASDRLGLRRGEYVVMEVRDTGEGMSPVVQQRIFEPFFSTKGPQRGTGLGLATCYGIITQSGGTITVHSSPGQGCTFTILLPAVNR